MSDQEPQHHHHCPPQEEPIAHQFHFPTNNTQIPSESDPKLHPHYHQPTNTQIPSESDPKLYHHYHRPTKHVPPPHVPARGRHVATAIIIAVLLLLIIGVAFLTLWLVYRPHKPRFTVVAAAVYLLNATSPPLLVAGFQFTLVARNPNCRVSILYDHLTTYVSYRNQAITDPMALPAIHQPRKATVAFSPMIGGQGVPVSVDVTNGLATDVTYGVVPMAVVVVGKLRWKVGVLRTKRYRVCVKCDILIGLKRGCSLGQVPLLGSSQCKVDM